MRMYQSSDLFERILSLQKAEADDLDSQIRAHDRSERLFPLTDHSPPDRCGKPDRGCAQCG
jgi:hypothetical protein